MPKKEGQRLEELPTSDMSINSWEPLSLLPSEPEVARVMAAFIGGWHLHASICMSVFLSFFPPCSLDPSLPISDMLVRLSA